MDFSPPPQPKYGALIELARKGHRITIHDAAERARVSKATWIDNARGYRKRGTAFEPVEPKPETIAAMANAAGVTPERMEAEGERTDVAEIMSEQRRLVTEAMAERDAEYAEPDSEAEGAEVIEFPGDHADFIEQLADIEAELGGPVNRRDRVERAIAAQHKTPEKIAFELREWREIRSHAPGSRGASGGR